MYLKVKLTAFCRLCPRQLGRERMEKSWNGLDQLGQVQSMSSLPNQMEQSTESSNVIYAWSMPLKVAFPPRGGQIKDGIVLRDALSCMCSSISIQSSPKLDGRAQNKGELCEGEQSRMQINREQRRRGVGKGNSQEVRGRVCQDSTQSHDAPLCVG